MSRAFLHRPFDGNSVLKPTGVLLARLHGTAGFVNAGNYDNFSVTMDVTEEDVWSPQTPERSKVGKLVTEQSMTVEFGLQQMPDFGRLIAMQSSPGLTLEQPAVADATFVIPNAKAGCIYRLPHKAITELSVTNDSSGVYVDEVNVQIDADTGNLEVIVHPGENPPEALGITVTYSAAAIEGRTTFGLMSDTDIHLELMFRSTNRYGPLQLVELWDLKTKINGALTLGSNSSEQATIPYMGEVLADATRDLAFAYGKVTTIPRRQTV